MAKPMPYQPLLLRAIEFVVSPHSGGKGRRAVTLGLDDQLRRSARGSAGRKLVAWR